ncbi:tetraspanin-8-like [Pelmatolapia mariae]|uniref:tetraspanin-8-like n=1 Tax=Pelmatolapia mariae TaxID=158779 RepID=UPI002FE58768
MAVNKCIKYLLFFFNLLFWLSGCLILAVSIYLRVSKGGNQITDQYFPAVNLMIAIGAIIMVLGFLGCCGALRESRCMLLLFFIFLLIIFILLVAAGIAGAVSQNKMQDWVNKQLETMVPLSSQTQSVINDLENLQKDLKCCGLVNGKSDWSSVPDSCRCNYTIGATPTPGAECGSDRYYSTPCSTRIVNLMKDNMVIVLGIAFGIAVLLIFGLAFSMALYCQIGKKDGPTTNA